jgi:hypothetical protein
MASRRKRMKTQARQAAGDFRVWHIPQVPGKPFHVDLNHVLREDAPEEAKRILRLLADYDLFQLENKIKPDYANAQGLEIFEDGEWIEWDNEDGEDITEIMRREE